MSAALLSPVRAFAQGEALARLAAAGDVGSPFQRAGWLGCWLEATGGLAGFRLVEIESTGGTTLLPVELVMLAGLRVARKIGGGHASFFTPVRVGSPAPLTKAMLKAATRALEADALVLTDCLESWVGTSLFAAPFPPAPDVARGVTLNAETRLYTGEAGKKLRAKARKLASLGGFTSGFVTGEAAQRALEAMLGWKAAQFAARGIRDPFAGEEMARFMTTGLTQGALRLYAVQLEQKPIAALMLVQAGPHASAMTIAYDPTPDIARFSPGDVLVSQLVETLASEGITGFDLGVGEARYKRLHCPEPMALVDVYAATSLKGAAYVSAHALARRAKGAIKRNAGAFSALTALRAKLRGRPSEA